MPDTPEDDPYYKVNSREINLRAEGRQRFLAVAKAAEDAVDEVQRYSDDVTLALRAVRNHLRSMRGMGYPREEFGDSTYLTDKLAEALTAAEAVHGLIAYLPAIVEAVTAPTTYPKPYGDGTAR